MNIDCMNMHECLAQEISYLSAGESIGETPFS